MTSSVLLQRTSDDLLRVAVAAYLARYKGLSRAHTDSDLQVFLRWCGERDLDPLAARRVDVELFVRWLQKARRFKPSTVSRRLSVVICFYRTCVIDAVLDYSPAAYVRRPSVPTESPTLGLSHLQFEAMIVAARTSINPFDFALVAMLGLLGLRIFEACAASINDLGEEHGHRVLRVCGKGSKVVLVPLPPAVGRAIDQAAGDRLDEPILLNRTGGRMDRHAATRRLRHLARTAGVRMPRMHPHMLCHTFVTTMLDAGVSLVDVQIAARRPENDHALRPRPQRTSTAIRTASSRRLWHPEPNQADRALAASPSWPMSVRPRAAVSRGTRPGRTRGPPGRP
jgi:integrase/recombinase XerD